MDFEYTKAEIAKLRRRAKKLDLSINYDRTYNRYVIIDNPTNSVAAYPTYMTLEEVDAWISDLEREKTADSE